MRFHALLPVRDEADIIGQCLDRLLTWADAIYVFDTGSVDNTWEIVQDYAFRDNRVIMLRKDSVYFAETRLRGWMFDRARKRMHEGDWFLRVDADEFHHITPPEFVKTRMERHETIAYHQYYDFQLTDRETEAWENGAETLKDRDRPIEERRRWYIPSNYSEPRLCKYRESMHWPSTASFPYNAGFLARERLPIRHYPHRDPAQLARRCKLRAIMMADRENKMNWSHPELHHWAQNEWRTFIKPENDPELVYWAEGSSLREYHYDNHLATPVKRIAQRVLHAAFLPVVDRMRPGWESQTYPQKISSNVIDLLENELKC